MFRSAGGETADGFDATNLVVRFKKKKTEFEQKFLLCGKTFGVIEVTKH